MKLQRVGAKRDIEAWKKIEKKESKWDKAARVADKWNMALTFAKCREVKAITTGDRRCDTVVKFKLLENLNHLGGKWRYN